MGSSSLDVGADEVIPFLRLQGQGGREVLLESGEQVRLEGHALGLRQGDQLGQVTGEHPPEVTEEPHGPARGRTHHHDGRLSSAASTAGPKAHRAVPEDVPEPQQVGRSPEQGADGVEIGWEVFMYVLDEPAPEPLAPRIRVGGRPHAPDESPRARLGAPRVTDQRLGQGLPPEPPIPTNELLDGPGRELPFMSE